MRLAGRVLDGLGLTWLEGEVSQVSQRASGHVYFALRDREAVSRRARRELGHHQLLAVTADTPVIAIRSA